MKEALEEMWAALAAYQPQADKDGHGKSWAKMCREKTYAAAEAAAEAAAPYAPYAAADAAAFAAVAYDAYAAAKAKAKAKAAAKWWAQKAINRINSVIKPAQRKAAHSIKENTCQ